MATVQLANSSPIPRRSRHPLTRSAVYAVLLIGLAVTLLPFIWILMTSLKPASEIVRIPPTFFPEQWTFNSYQTIFNDPKVPLARFYLNSLLVSVGRVVITLFTSSLAGYIFAKFAFRGKNVLFGFILVQLMIPFQVVMIPAYLILVQLRLIDSLWGLVIPSMIDAFGIFLMRQFISTFPNDLIDAARIDGASEFGVYARVVMPNLGAPLATLGIFTFMATWNDYLWPLIVITTHEKRTLPLLLTWYTSQHGQRYDLTMAASILVLLPILVAYIFFQRWIVRGIALTGMK
ncbi:carbohydrate ABC transporter permease [Caldilinea sp.]|uniref:carbohydrate ABC transporter permease n=1 Tax=Caldilinea sp. TaxID=2293560 RepID=UPI002C69BA9D|nr:carbohydrate ABC transporter permease [Anaerolineales bacterium]HQY91270.1 carbohydrate ABC transporter permease [Caldilinea sp.]HRA68441.1 carbohydrate ABC transporter permease [Caldilinea sp.]